MAAVYGRLPAHPRLGLQSDLLQVGSFWAARGDDGDEWCRVVVLEVLESPSGDGAAEYRVRCVDYGDEMLLSAAHLRPMLERFAAVPVYIVRAACSGVAPAEGEPVYSEAACERFLELVDGPEEINAHVVRSESTDECLAVVLYTVLAARVVALTEQLAAEGLALHWQVEEAPEPASRQAEGDWGLRWPADGPLALRPGSLVYVRVTAVVTPALFYVVLPFGARPAHAVNANFADQLLQLGADDSVETLAAAMRRYYGPRAVAVRWQGGWHRGRVLALDEHAAEVFLTDWGHTEPVPLEELRELMRGFQQLPAQALDLYHARPDGGGGVWASDALCDGD
ncbi:tudor domain-containing protein 1-like [Pollicipes pollicipes]|uniref:tudor domain-containing protein 1-like n=1 Tax=Pollicipes pollicipes TaxID=41117 RepID=UPI001885A264|nr:tudor domain-containing protein 1-like [Pollicipes pollicipes]